MPPPAMKATTLRQGGPVIRCRAFRAGPACRYRESTIPAPTGCAAFRSRSLDSPSRRVTKAAALRQGGSPYPVRDVGSGRLRSRTRGVQLSGPGISRTLANGALRGGSLACRHHGRRGLSGADGRRRHGAAQGSTRGRPASPATCYGRSAPWRRSYRRCRGPGRAPSSARRPPPQRAPPAPVTRPAVPPPAGRPPAGPPSAPRAPPEYPRR